MPSELHILPVATDNYCYIVVVGNDAIAIDTSSAEPVRTMLDKRRLSLRCILSTHCHADHTGGNAVLHELTGCTIVGGDRRICGIGKQCTDHERITVGEVTFECIAVPGHTSGSYAYHFPDFQALFTGDTLFYAGCGRILESDADTLYHSLMKITAFPDTTRVYCGHEYTLDNLAFARTVEPGNGAVSERAATVKRQLNVSTVYGPSTIAVEKATNPFLRCNEPAVRTSVGLPAGASPEAVFKELRRRKDVFG